jgi:hypothetical protein
MIFGINSTAFAGGWVRVERDTHRILHISEPPFTSPAKETEQDYELPEDITSWVNTHFSESDNPGEFRFHEDFSVTKDFQTPKSEEEVVDELETASAISSVKAKNNWSDKDIEDLKKAIGIR